MYTSNFLQCFVLYLLQYHIQRLNNHSQAIFYKTVTAPFMLFLFVEREVPHTFGSDIPRRYSKTYERTNTDARVIASFKVLI